MEIDVIKYHKYQAFKSLLYNKYTDMRNEGFEIKEGSNVFKLIDKFSEELANKINVTPNINQQPQGKTILQQPQGAIHPDTELLKHLIGHLTVTESGDLDWPYSEMVDGIRDAGESSDVVDALVKRKSELYGKGKG